MAQEDEEVNWLDCVSAIETDRGVVYFCDNEYFAQGRWSSGPEQQNVDSFRQILEEISAEKSDDAESDVQDEPEAELALLNCFDKVPAESKPLLTPIADFVSRFEHGRFMYSITAYNPLDTQQDTVQNCLNNQLLEADLREAFPGPDCRIFSNFSYFPHKPHHFERGFTVVLPIDYPKDHESMIHAIALKYRQAAYFKCRIQPNGENSQIIVLLEDYVREVQEKLVVVERLSYHPAYLHPKNNSVFHLFDDAMNTLSKCQYLPEAYELLNIAKHQLMLRPFGNNASSPKQRHPVLVMEGTSNAGVSKHSFQLSQALGAMHLQSPPLCISHLRKKFDSQNQLIRGAFYTVGNYIVASQVEEASKETPVVVDRYWNSTAAFTITSEVGRGSANLPPKDHFVYEWPADLPKPTAVVLVGSRKGIRNEAKTTKGKEDRHVKQLMFEILRRMKNSSWIEVDQVKDNCQSDDAVTMVTIDKLQEKQVVNFHAGSRGHGLCPGATLHPKLEHDILPVDASTSNIRSKVKGNKQSTNDKEVEVGFL